MKTKYTIIMQLKEKINFHLKNHHNQQQHNYRHYFFVIITLGI